MAKCPKCGLDYANNIRKCPNCKTLLSSRKSNIEDLPKLKNEVPLKIEEDNDIKIKKIPMRVKKVEKHIIKEKNSFKETIKYLKLVSTIKIVLVILLLVLNVCLVVDITLKIDGNMHPNVVNVEEPIIKEVMSDVSINGLWRTQNDGLFIFQEDNSFYWYDNYQVRDDNYYGGTYTYRQGVDALNDMGYTEEDIIKEFGNIDLDNIYSISLKPIIAYKDRQDKTVVELNENEVWWFLLIIDKENGSFGYNKTLDLRYNLEKAI